MKKMVIIFLSKKGNGLNLLMQICITLVVASYLGTEFTFAAPVEGNGKAFGQIMIEWMKDIYTVKIKMG